MAYTDFTLDILQQTFTLTIAVNPLFHDMPAHVVPPWLQQTLAKGMPLAFLSEKARSEFIIAPILLTVRELYHNRVTIYSGQRFDGDPGRGLIGECDFILTASAPLPMIQAPIISIVEAKKNDIESGLGQCAAQMVGAQCFNQRHQSDLETIFGCVTTGEVWQFLKLTANTLEIDSQRYYITEMGVILNIFMTIISHYLPLPSSPASSAVASN